MKDIIKLVYIMFLVCGIAAGSLAFVNKATKARIAEYARVAQGEALKEVFPEAERFNERIKGEVWDAIKGGEMIGSVFLRSVQGYSGPIKIVFGRNRQGAIIGVRVLSHTETPGLGAKITRDEFLKQYRGKMANELELKKDDPAKGAIDAISAATISSRAVTQAIREEMKETAKEKPVGDGGAQ